MRTMLKWLGRIEEFSSGLLFVSGILVSLYAVIMRYIFNMPPAWALEIFEFLMVWAIFIGFGIALKENHHIVVDLLYDRFPFAVKRAVSVIANLIGAGYSIFMTVTGIQMTALAREQQIVTIDVGIPIWITYIVMPIGMGLMAFYFLLKTIRAIKGDRREIMGHIDHEQYVNETHGKGGLSI